MDHVRRRIGRRAALALALLATAGTAGAGPAHAAVAGASEPTVTITATDGTWAQVADCKGHDRSLLVEPATVRVTRAGSTSGDLPVTVTWGGSAITGTAPSGTVTIPDGAPYASVEVGDGPGDVTASIVDTAGYAVGEPGTATASIATMVVDLACNMGDVSVTRTTEVGGTPDPIEVRNWPSPDMAKATFSVEGTQPPGLALHADGSWEGAATTEGTWTFSSYYCDADDYCFDRYDITVVVGPDLVAPPPAPPPAAPVADDATFTG